MMSEHCREQRETLVVEAVLRVAGNESGPGDEVSARHFVEQLVGGGEMAAFGIQVD